MLPRRVCSSFQQHANNHTMSTCSCRHEWCGSATSHDLSRVDACAAQEQQLAHIGPTKLAGDEERRDAIRAGRVHVGAMVDQQTDNRHLPTRDRLHQRLDRPVSVKFKARVRDEANRVSARVSGIDQRAVFEQ
jgi:hypothetical protein